MDTERQQSNENHDAEQGEEHIYEENAMHVEGDDQQPHESSIQPENLKIQAPEHNDGMAGQTNEIMKNEVSKTDEQPYTVVNAVPTKEKWLLRRERKLEKIRRNEKLQIICDTVFWLIITFIILAPFFMSKPPKKEMEKTIFILTFPDLNQAAALNPTFLADQAATVVGNN